jgi:hypothetical protein
MALDTFTLIASQYALEEDALEDYDSVRAAYEDLGIIDTYDAAVVTKGPDGKVRIVERIEEPDLGTERSPASRSVSPWERSSRSSLPWPWVRGSPSAAPREPRSAPPPVTSSPG